MKNLFLFSLILLAFGLVSCDKSDDGVQFPAELDEVIQDLTKSFDSLNVDMAAGALAVGPNVADTAAIRAKCAELLGLSTFVDEFSFVNQTGILGIVEPSQYYYVQGADISQQDHIVAAFQTKLPVMSGTFMAVEGFYGTVITHPVLQGSTMVGGLNALFRPAQILGRIITPYVTNQSFEMWIMEAGGNVLYDQDAYEIGRNVITDPLYADFPELIAAAQLIDSEDSGETTYSFFQTGTTTQVVKKTYWKTFTLYGMAWKIIWVKAI